MTSIELFHYAGWAAYLSAAATIIVNSAVTLSAFVSILEAEVGNLTLKVLAGGGVYLGGGFPPRILPTLEDERFMEAFRRKGRVSDFLACVPMHVILNPKIALLGPACHGLEPAHA
jgi:glucokinase